MAETTISVRMYNVGFGDAFLVTVSNTDATWRMLVDCGVHAHGRVKIDGVSRDIRETVETIKSDLADPGGGTPLHLDVIVATHRHADHVSGFAEDAWADVEVDEVWVPFVEDKNDADAVKLRTKQTESADALHRAALALAASNRLSVAAERAAAESAAASHAPGDREAARRRAARRVAAAERALEARAVAEEFAVNSLFEGPNLAAMERLIGDDGGFANHPRVRFLPDPSPEENRIATTVPGVSVTVLGPSRKAEDLKKMDPPKKDHWLAYARALDPEILVAPRPLFARAYIVPADRVDALIPEAVRNEAIDLVEVGSEVDSLLTAAAVLESAVNNTSIFFVLDVNGQRLLFVGDSQEGAWRHVLDDPASRAELDNLLFYKIGHHGSHNATPKRFVNEVLKDKKPVYAMLPWGLVKEWEKTIPKEELITALEATSARIVKAAELIDDEQVSSDPQLRWTQVDFTVP